MNYLRLKQLRNKINISKSKIYADMKNKNFPTNIKLGRMSLWIEEEIDEYIKFISCGNKTEGEVKEFVKHLMSKRN